MFKFVVLSALLALAVAEPSAHLAPYVAPVSYTSPAVAAYSHPLVSTYSAPVVSHYSAFPHFQRLHKRSVVAPVTTYSAHGFVAPVSTYSAHGFVAPVSTYRTPVLSHYSAPLVHHLHKRSIVAPLAYSAPIHHGYVAPVSAYSSPIVSAYNTPYVSRYSAGHFIHGIHKRSVVAATYAAPAAVAHHAHHPFVAASPVVSAYSAPYVSAYTSPFVARTVW